jgi:peptidyl-prolyl cis-trans isomerase SurA
MRKLVLSLLTLTVCSSAVHAQTLFTYGGTPVSKDEFLKVYKKNSMNKTPDMSDTALKNYLDLYALFRMKVAEADKEKLDTVQSISRELANYRKQLSKNYLTDEEMTNKLIREAYDRMKVDVHVAHILVSCPQGSDTTIAYSRIDSIYRAIQNKGASFETMAAEFSDDKGSKDNGGDIGYFTALQTVFPFENMAYNTPVGKMSKPFRTQFGYHIIKVLGRQPDRGQVKVAQIMISTPKFKADAGVQAAKLRADSVEAMLKGGASWDDLVARYSEDQYTNKIGGVMKPFGAGRMVKPFEDACFALNKPGDISEPIKTEFGYHIIKLIEKEPLAPYDTLYPSLKHRVEGDSRAQTAKEQFYDKIKEKNGYKEYAENITEISRDLASIPDTGKSARQIKADNYKNMTKPVFTLAGKNYTQADFAKFLETLTHGKFGNGSKNMIVHDGLRLYQDNVVNDFEEHKLVDENPEFKSLMEEYRDGIMLFELMDRHVWSKAAHDSVGLEAYYTQNKSRYTWEPGFEGSVYKFKTKAIQDSGMILINSHMGDEDIAKTLNNNAHSDAVSIQHGHFEFSHFKDVTLTLLQQNAVQVVPSSSAPFEVVVAKTVYPTSTQKSLAEARGYVVAEYQDHLEKEWNQKMRKEYPLKVNEAVFKTMVKK